MDEKASSALLAIAFSRQNRLKLATSSGAIAMILSFGFKNFFSFKEGAHISFELNSKVPKEISKGRKVSTILGIKGANGSGKTNILKALSFLSSFCCNSFSEKESKFINIDSHFSNESASDFYINFSKDGITYTYELKATEEKIIREALYKKSKRKTLILERLEDEIKYRATDLSEVDLIRLKPKASIISTANKYKFEKENTDLNTFYDLFYLVLANVGYSGMIENWITHSINEISEKYNTDTKAFEFAKHIIKTCDLGITDIRILSREDENGKQIFYPVFIHTNKTVEYPLLASHQSSGTISLYKKLYLYWITLSVGGVLAMDEFDTNFHPLILPEILKLFDNPEVNKNDAQIIFTAHNTEIIDTLSKYRTILVNKEDNESFCYRLDEIPGDLIRNDRLISPIYSEGKIGGVPKI